MTYENLGQPWQETSKYSEVLPIRANHKWVFLHHPTYWEIVEFKEELPKKVSKFIFLPLLKTQLEIPGVNCIRVNGNQTDTAFARSKLESSGWQIIDPKSHDYLRVYPARNGRYFTSKFQQLENLGGEILKSFDHESFNFWRRELMAKGVINLPHPQILKRMVVAMGQKIDRHAKNQHIPEINIKMKRYQEQIDQMKTAISDIKTKGAQAYV